MTSGNGYALFGRILTLSKATTWDEAKQEWELDSIEFASPDDSPWSCLCGHTPIKELCYLRNWKTNEVVVVGNHCVRHFLGFDHICRITAAVKEKRINADVIEYSYQRGIINDWERGFLENVHRKRKLSVKQADKLAELNVRIFSPILRAEARQKDMAATI